ncbi:MAG TPA: hypothetical protein VER83_06685 [Candidatus Nanopelagicales bacterium]|nr:hypothetical protein [Candidatus Nanopelagicales bacterium]
MTKADDPFESLGAPARRALDQAGIRRLEDLRDVTRLEVLALHGMGPRAMGRLEVRLRDAGTWFREERP